MLTMSKMWKRVGARMRAMSQSERAAWMREGKDIDELNRKVQTRQVVRRGLFFKEMDFMNRTFGGETRHNRRSIARARAHTAWRKK